jgi:hypothetical protein
LTRQCEHSGRPWASRAAGSRTAPHAPHGTARARAQQRRQTRSPSRRLLNATNRLQRGQAGRRTRVPPASHNASTSRSTIGNGALAPAPVSSSGASCNAQTSFRTWPRAAVDELVDLGARTPW